MKNLILVMTIFTFILGSCSNGNKDSQKSNAKEIIAPVKNIDPDDCGTFMDKYEDWSKTYITTLRIFKSDPSNPKLAQRYSYQTRELKQWTKEWTEYMECADEGQYLNRYTKISENIEKEQKRLEGL